MAPEKVAFRVVVWYEAAALVSGGKIPPWTHFLMKLSPAGRTVAAAAAGVWMLSHLEVLKVRHPRGQVLP